jgi:hypothetical protein
MRTLTFSSDLPADPALVWARVTTMAGINHELGPWLAMRPPPRWRDASIVDLPLGEPLGRAWILLGGVLPVDADDLTISELEPGRWFQERSRLLSARRWEHRRTITPSARGCRVTDVVGLEGRLLLPTAVLARVIGLVFAHRHRRLASSFGAVPR